MKKRAVQSKAKRRSAPGQVLRTAKVRTKKAPTDADLESLVKEYRYAIVFISRCATLKCSTCKALAKRVLETGVCHV